MNDSFQTFKALHHGATPFVLANAWNVKSAQVIEKNGFAAIGTSSGAISNSLGYEDGEKMPFHELLYIVKRIKACTSIPLSVDLERGYSDDEGELIDHINMLTDAGVAGINLEDAQGEYIYLRKLHCIKDHLERSNRKLFLNARTDGFLQKLPQPLELTIRRAKSYQDAGADGLFVTGVSDPETISKIAGSISLPLNIVASPKLSSFKTLADCGVSRISMAVLLYNATYNNLNKLADSVKFLNSTDPLFGG